MEDNEVKQPTIEYQELLDSLMENTPTEVEFLGKSYKIYWLTNKTVRRFSHSMVSEKDPDKRAMKLVAAILCNGNYFRTKFWWHIYWRWLYHFASVSQVDVLRILDAGKKKVPQEAYLLSTMLQTGLTDLMMAMISEEAEHIRQEQAGGQHSL